MSQNLPTNQNKITLKDIRTRKKFWWKPSDTDYRDLILWVGWTHWNSNYSYLPIPDKFIKIQTETLTKLKTLPKLEYFITRNKNNTLTIILQNQKSYDFSNPSLVLFFGNDTESSKPFLYRITSVDYINNRTLYCQITAERDPIWAYYGNFMNSKGSAKINQAQFGTEHNQHLDSSDSNFKERIDNCIGCQMCYDFCGDLRWKKAKKGSLKSGSGEKDIEFPWQPKWGIVYIDPRNMPASPSGYYLPAANIEFGACFKLEQWKPSSGFLSTLLPQMDTPFLTFLVSKQHWEQVGSKGRLFDVEEYVNDNAIKYPLPDIFNQYPHLLDHSSTQFFFQKKLLTTANLKHVDIRKIDGKFHLVLGVRIRSSIAGILYYFESKEIFFKMELKVQGSVSNNNFLKVHMKIIGKVMEEIKRKMGDALQIVSLGMIKLSPPPKTPKVPTGSELTERTLGSDLKSEDSPETEQQTERKYKSTLKALGRVVEPAIFYSNTVDFNYDFWEFANRSIENPFEIRFEHSDMLLNNLKNSNNKTPYHNIYCRYSAFKQLVKVGDFQADIKPWWDHRGIWRNICGAGTFFYDDPSQLFKPWQPTFKLTQSSDFRALADIGNIVGEEEPYEEDKEEKVASGDTGNVGYSCSTFLRTSNPSQQDLLKNVKGCSSDWGQCPPGSGRYGWCWGCFSHTINTHGGDGTEYVCQGTFDPTEDTDIEFCLIKNNFTTQQAAKCQAGKSYTVILKRTGTTIDIYFKWKDTGIRYKEEKNDIDRETDYQSQEWIEPEILDENTQFRSLIGEVDPEKPESERPENETEGEQPETDKEVLKEKGGELEKDFEKELEKEKEREREREKERELERELEKEKEREKGKEKELEREKQREREKQAERDKKDRESQSEKDRKERERLERENKAREKERARREKQRQEKEKKEKERKERE